MGLQFSKKPLTVGLDLAYRSPLAELTGWSPRAWVRHSLRYQP